MVMITDPSVSGPSSGPVVTGTVSGALQGAQIGSIFGPVGTGIGAVLGGLGGLFGGKKASKAAYYKRQATAWQRMGQARQVGLQRNQLLRQYRITRANALMGIIAEAGGLDSSAPQGALSSGGSQFAFSDAYLEGQRYISQKVEHYSDKSGKAMEQAANLFAGFDLAGQLAQTAAPFFTANSNILRDRMGAMGRETGGIVPTPSSTGVSYGPGFVGPR